MILEHHQQTTPGRNPEPTMGLPRRNKHDKENHHAARPWDNAQTGVKALCAAFEERPRDDSRKALHDFIEQPSPNVRTRIGNREIKPLVQSPKPPPLVGLPIPGKPHMKKIPLKPVQVSPPVLRSRSPTDSQRILGIPVEMELHDHDDHPLPAKLPEPATPGMCMEDPELMPRFSYRQSVRQSVRLPKGSLNDSNKASSRMSRRVDGERLSFLPKSSSFLDFNDDERLEPLEPEKEKQVWKGMTFDDEADTFDTFESVDSPQEEEEEEEEEQEPQEQEEEELVECPEIEPREIVPRPESDESEKPLFPAMSFTRKSGGPLPVGRRVDDEEDGGLDVPKRMTRRPGAEGALRDLQRASITAGQELQQSLRMMAKGEQQKKTRDSKVQGDLFLRSRIFRRWNLRYASIVQQGYFGAVLLLFRPEGRGVASGLALKSSKMIALAESTVRVVEGKRLDLFMFELKTSQRTYNFACNDEDQRDYWMKNLGSHQ